MHITVRAALDHSDISAVLTVSRLRKVVSVAVGPVGVRPFTAASYRIEGIVVVSLTNFSEDHRREKIRI